MERPLKDKRPFGPILDFSQSRDPFTTKDGSGVVFRPSLDPNEKGKDMFSNDPLAASEHIRVFLESLGNQQPELNIAASEVIVMTGFDSDTVNEYQIAIPMLEPVLIFSHIEDAIREMRVEVGNSLSPGDHVVLPRDEIRNQLDRSYEMDTVKTTFAAQTIL